MTGGKARRLLAHVLAAGLAGVLLGSAWTAVAGATTAGISTPTGPSQSQIDATQAQVASIETAIVSEQQKSDALSQQYDAAEQQLQQAQTALQATQATIAKTKAEIRRDRAHLATASVRAYMDDAAATQAPVLFTSSANVTAARRKYSATAISDLVSARTALDRAKAKLDAVEAQQQDEEHQAQLAASQAQSLEQQNAAVEKAAQATLAQVKGTLAAQVAKAAEVQAQKAAAAAAAAQAQREREAAAQRAAQAALVTQVLGTSEEGATATQLSNQAASSAGQTVTAATISPSGATSSAGQAAVAAAESQLGVPYVWGGESPGHGFDCSGLAQWAWSQAGVSIPRTTEVEWPALSHVSLSALQPGDLLFYFNLDGTGTVDHVVMYVGSGPFGAQTVIAAPYTGTVVQYQSISTYGLQGAARP